MLENERAVPVLKFPKKLLMKITHSSPPSQDPNPLSQERAQESLLKKWPTTDLAAGSLGTVYYKHCSSSAQSIRQLTQAEACSTPGTSLENLEKTKTIFYLSLSFKATQKESLIIR